MTGWSDVLQKSVSTGLGGAGVGALTAGILNLLSRANKPGIAPSRVVPSNIIEQPLYISEEEAEKLRQRGIDVKDAHYMGKLAHDNGISLLSLGSVAEMVKEANEQMYGPTPAAQSTLQRAAMMALPILTGVGGGYFALNAFDRYLDRLHKNKKKREFEDTREQLHSLLSQDPSGALDKVASAHVDGDPVVSVVPYVIPFCASRFNEKHASVLDFLRTPGAGAQAWENIKDTTSKGLGDMSIWAIGLPALIGAGLGAIPAYRRSTAPDSKKMKRLRETDEFFANLPDKPRVKLVPVVRRGGKKKEEDNSDEY